MANIWDKPFTQQSSTPANPFFDPSSTYGGDRDWTNTPLAGQIREQNPQLAYTQYGNQSGVSGNDGAFRNWFYQQYPEFQRGYGMATLRNPLITMDEYLKTLPSMDALRQQYMRESPYERGIRNAIYAPVSRWISR